MIIPVIDEAGMLENLLADLGAQRGIALECVVADGGSRDASPAIARAAGATLVNSRAGRAAQMNAGAAAATGQWLCFLHADSRLTHPAQLCAGVARLAALGQRCVAGHFALRFLRTTRGHGFFYRYLEAKTASGRRYTINGDQGLLLRRAFFDALGGFDERQAFLEDQRMAAQIERHGRWCLLEHRLASSARRFEVEGEAARYALMALIMTMHIADVPAFFERAPSVYARQGDTQRLALMPYMRLLRRMISDCGIRRSLAVAWKIAGIALTQAWQVFFALDVLLGQGHRARSARVYERYLKAGVEQPLTQALLLIVLAFAIFGPLQLWGALRAR